MNTLAEVPCWEVALGLQLGAETGVTERHRRESVAVLNCREMDRGRRAAMWVSPHHPPVEKRA